MPNIDVSALLSDPDFAEALTIERTSVTTGENGRDTTTVETISPPPYGVVAPGSTSILLRTPDAQYRPARITVYTTFRLRGPAPGYRPDAVIWNGDPYIVTALDNFSHFGVGFIVAICDSTDAIDQAPV